MKNTNDLYLWPTLNINKLWHSECLSAFQNQLITRRIFKIFCSPISKTERVLLNWHLFKVKKRSIDLFLGKRKVFIDLKLENSIQKGYKAFKFLQAYLADYTTWLWNPDLHTQIWSNVICKHGDLTCSYNFKKNQFFNIFMGSILIIIYVFMKHLNSNQPMSHTIKFEFSHFESYWKNMHLGVELYMVIWKWKGM